VTPVSSISFGRNRFHVPEARHVHAALDGACQLGHVRVPPAAGQHEVCGHTAERRAAGHQCMGQWTPVQVNLLGKKLLTSGSGEKRLPGGLAGNPVDSSSQNRRPPIVAMALPQTRLTRLTVPFPRNITRTRDRQGTISLMTSPSAPSMSIFSRVDFRRKKGAKSPF